MNIYCGNNQFDPDILNGSLELGTRYRCLQKGFGKGLHLPYDSKYAGDYQPIDDTKIYCGNRDNLPENYDRFGNLPQCLQKGIALGKRQIALKGPPSFFKNYIKYFLMLFISILVFLILFFVKPSFITKIEENKKIIVWEKFLLYYFLIVIILSIIIYYIV
jgi:hypothetical protein